MIRSGLDRWWLVDVEQVRAGDEAIGFVASAYDDVAGFEDNRHVDDVVESVLLHRWLLGRFNLAELRDQGAVPPQDPQRWCRLPSNEHERFRTQVRAWHCDFVSGCSGGQGRGWCRLVINLAGPYFHMAHDALAHCLAASSRADMCERS